VVARATASDFILNMFISHFLKFCCYAISELMIAATIQTSQRDRNSSTTLGIRSPTAGSENTYYEMSRATEMPRSP
jgi:hypothetical protein